MGLTRGFIRGKTLATTDDLTNKANTSHTHSTDDITSGTLPLSRGGTGVTSISALKSALGISSSSGVKIYCDTGIMPSNVKLDFTPLFYIGETKNSSPSYIGYTFIEWGIKEYEYCTRIQINNDGVSSPTLNKVIANWASDRINLAYTFVYILILGT